MADHPSCRLTGEPLEVVLDLGRQPLGNGFLEANSRLDDEFFYHLRCGFGSQSKLFQLVEQPSPTAMFHGDYAFRSGTSQTMVKHFAHWADKLATSLNARVEDPLVVEIGSNDGVFLKHMADRGVRHLGVDPSDNVADIAESQGVRVLRDFFSAVSAAKILEDYGPADAIVAANAMCHIPDINGVADGVATLLSENGVLTFEDPYLGDVLRLGSYDQIYDEHVFLFSATSVSNIFGRVGLELIDVQPIATHGGSMRYTLGRQGSHKRNESVDQLLCDEDASGMGNVETYLLFARRVSSSADSLRDLLQDLSHQGEEVVAYGATSKSTTVYNYASIGNDLVTAIFDSTPNKQFKVSPGMHIPILPETDFQAAGARYCYLGAWNHEAEIRSKNAAFEARGGRWISHVPEVRVIGA